MQPVQIISLTVSTFCFILFIVMLIKSIKLKIDITFMLGAIFLITLGNSFVTIFTNELLFIGQILMSAGFLSFFFHYEAIASVSPNKYLMIIMISVFTGAATIYILLLIYLNSPETADLGVISNLNIMEQPRFLYSVCWSFAYNLTTILILTVFGRAINIFYRIHKQAKIKPTRIELIALMVLFAYRTLFLLVNFVSSASFNILSSIGLVLSIIGMLLLISNYILNSDYIYLLPFPIHSLMVYNKGGILCYIRKFDNVTPDLDNAAVIMTGAFTAISALIQETLGSRANIQNINAQQYQIYFNRLSTDAGNLVVISYGETAFFAKSLQRVAKSIDPKLLNEMNTINDLAYLEPKFDIIFKKSFPYIKFPEKKI